LLREYGRPAGVPGSACPFSGASIEIETTDGSSESGSRSAPGTSETTASIFGNSRFTGSFLAARRVFSALRLPGTARTITRCVALEPASDEPLELAVELGAAGLGLAGPQAEDAQERPDQEETNSRNRGHGQFSSRFSQQPRCHRGEILLKA